MIKEGTKIFYGKSGMQYQFDIYPKNAKFDNDSAVYIFCKRHTSGFQVIFSPLYIGETGELGARIANHEKWDCVLSHDCTHICVMQVTGKNAERDRLAVEKDLRHNYDTPCNEQ